MGRPPRCEVAGGCYHVTQRGNNGAAIFLDDDDRAFFLSFLARVVLREAWLCLSYCLLTNHYHVVVRIPVPSLGRGMSWLNGVYAQLFNHKHGRTGHVFGGRYRAGLIESEKHFEDSCLYVELNPVRAGLCEHPRDWPWSSYRARAGEAPAPPFLWTGRNLPNSA